MTPPENYNREQCRKNVRTQVKGGLSNPGQCFQARYPEPLHDIFQKLLSKAAIPEFTIDGDAPPPAQPGMPEIQEEPQETP